jgi:hypothetical protein
MADNKPFIESGKYDNRKDLLILYLKVLNEQNKPMTFSDLALNYMPGGGLTEFESAMSELESKKWITKTEEDGTPNPNLPFFRTVVRRYSISLEGVEYLASLGIIDDKHKTAKNTAGHSIHNYGNLVFGDNPQGINQGLGSENHLSSNNSMILDPASAKAQPIDTFNINSKLSIWQKIYKFTDHKLISMIVFAVLGFLISRLISWLGWF